MNKNRKREERIIINADDFGSNASINNAIVTLFDKGIINSTSLIANFNGFSEAVELSHEHRFANRVGIHLVLSEGNPLTDDIRNLTYLFNVNENLSALRTRKLFFLKNLEKEYIYNEFVAQIEKVRRARIRISHIDTHHQIHDNWFILEIILRLLKRYNIPYIRILNNLEKKGPVKNLYRSAINRYLFLKRVNFTDYMGDQRAFLTMYYKRIKFFKGRSIEIMVHPDINDNGDIIDKIGKKEYDFSFMNKLFS